jgi:hypothetical protein
MSHLKYNICCFNKDGNAVCGTKATERDGLNSIMIRKGDLHKVINLKERQMSNRWNHFEPG